MARSPQDQVEIEANAKHLQKFDIAFVFTNF